MKLKFLAAILLVLTFCSFRFLQTKKHIVFFGDSITRFGVKPNGYVTLFEQKLKEKNLDGKFDVIGAGISGNKVYDLYLRMEDDVLAKKPDAVVIWIGVNDVWAKVKRGTGTDPNTFGAFYNAIIKKLKQNNISSIFLCTPATIGEKTDWTNEQDGDMNKYANLVKEIARKNNCKIIDLRSDFLQYDREHNPENKESGILTVDGVHLNDTGNQFVANEMYQALSQSVLK